MNIHYYECHVTIEPVLDDRLGVAEHIAKKHGFRMAKLLMKKKDEDTEARSDKDSFMTGTSKSYASLGLDMAALIRELKLHNFKVWRYKIEAILLDSKIEDHLFLLEENNG